MTSITRMVDADDPAVAVLRDGEVAEDAGCVMLWVQRAQRATANPAANLAVEIASGLRLPVVAVFCLVPAYPRATLRPYHFLAEGLRTLPDDFATRGIGWKLVTGEPHDEIPAVARELRAAAVVTDADPLRTGRQWREEVAARLAVPMVEVESDAVVPPALFPKEEVAPRTIRPKVQRHLDRYLVRIPDPEAPVASTLREGPDPLDAIGGFGLDTSVGPAPDLRGGSAVARERLRTFIAERLHTYDEDRQRDAVRAGTNLSPWLHYGQIGPTEMAVAIHEADAPQAARDALIDELVTQREVAINFALRNPDYDRYEGLPGWGRESLERHAADPRPAVFTREEFERAETDDALWNAAMTQMIHEGYLPNRVRMYWAKQILRWSATPRDAWDIAVHLNDRYFVDGRDANSYANLGWCIGGRHDRPFGPERAIFGLVRPMGMPAMKRTFDVNAYVRRVNERWGTPAPAAEQRSLFS